MSQQMEGWESENTRFQELIRDGKILEILVFRVGGSEYAIEVSQIQEILMIGEISKVPKAGKAIAGIGLVRGDLATVIDLRVILQNKQTPENEKKLALLCESESMVAALLVDEVKGIQKIQTHAVASVNMLANQDQIVGNINLNESIVFMLEAKRIINGCRVVVET